MTRVRTILDEIAPHNNVYRDTSASVRDKLAAMWEIGDALVKAGVTRAHSVGWTIQRETGGLVKRPTIFRSHKFRVVWPDKDEFLHRFGGIQGLSSLVEMLPLLDPAQRGKHRVPAGVVEDLARKMHSLPPGEFKVHLAAVKKKHADGTLGKTYNRGRDVGALHSLARSFNAVYKRLQDSVAPGKERLLGALRRDIPSEELRVFSNMCLALTTKDNRALCSELPDSESLAMDTAFRCAFDGAIGLLREHEDARRARFRKVVGPDVLADLADLSNSAITDKGVRAYGQRARVTIAL